MAQKLRMLDSCPCTLIEAHCLVVMTRSLFHVPADRIESNSDSNISVSAAILLLLTRLIIRVCVKTGKTDVTEQEKPVVCKNRQMVL